MIKAVIFDVDGVMIDTEALHSKAHTQVIKEYGKKPKLLARGTVHIVGKSIKENSKIIKNNYGIDEDVDILEDKKHKAFFNLIQNAKINPLHGLKKLIGEFKGRKIKMAVGTSGIKEGALVMLDKLGVMNNFTAIVALKDVKRPKPFPDIFLEAARKLTVNPEYCLVIEDSQSGVEAGKNAGMKVIAVPNKYTKGQNFSKADRIVDSLSDITIDMLKTL